MASMSKGSLPELMLTHGKKVIIAAIVRWSRAHAEFGVQDQTQGIPDYSIETARRFLALMSCPLRSNIGMFSKALHPI